MEINEMKAGACERVLGDVSKTRFGVEATGCSGNEGNERSARVKDGGTVGGGATDGLVAERTFEEGFYLAGGALLEESRGVFDESLRRELLVRALGSSAEAVARTQNRIRQDVFRLRENGGCDEHGERGGRGGGSLCGFILRRRGAGIDKGLLACILESLAEDIASLCAEVELRSSVYRELEEPAAAEAVRDAHGQFVESVLSPNVDLLNGLAERADRKGDFERLL